MSNSVRVAQKAVDQLSMMEGGEKEGEGKEGAERREETLHREFLRLGPSTTYMFVPASLQNG